MESRRTDGQVVGTTTAAGIFAFPLVRGLASVNTDECWSSLMADWTSGADTRSRWTSGAISGRSTVGNLTKTDAGFLRVYAQYCDRTNVSVLCAEQ